MKSELSQSEDSIFIIKGRFKSNTLNQYGLFLITFNEMKEIDNHQVIVTSYSDIYDLDPNTSWNEFEEYIVDRKWKGNYINNMTTSISDAFSKLSEDVNSLYESVHNFDHDRMNIILYDIINRIMHDKNLVLEAIIQEITPQELQNVREDRSKPQDQTEEDQDEKKDNSHVFLKIKPVLAPLNGKPIYELRIGDRIMVKIEPASNKEKNYIELNGLKDDRGIKSIPVTVIDIKSSNKNNPIEILTEIKSGIYGFCLEEEKLIKLKLYDPALDTLSKKAGRLNSAKNDSFSNKKSETSKTSKSIVVMSMFLIFILLIFIILVMFGFGL